MSKAVHHRPSVCVVIPALNEATHIAACVHSVLLQGVPAEIVVVDGGSTDDTRARVPAEARVVESARGRGAQMNAGARASRADVLLFLHADTTLHAGGLRALVAALASPEVPGGTFTLRFDQPGRLLALYAWCTRWPLPLFHYGDQGIFVRREIFDALGGYREWALMEDVDFLARMQRVGPLALIDLPVTTSARRFARLGVVRQQLLNALLMALYYLGVSPTRLARWYATLR